MPCYDPPPTPEQIKWWREDAKARGDIRYLYHDTPRKALEQWLCDLLTWSDKMTTRPPLHPDLVEWWGWHQKLERK